MAAPNGRGHRLTRRGPHSRGAREGSLYSVRSASVSASWLGSLAALSAATRTRAPKRATVNQKAAPSRGDFLRGSILTNATVHRTVAPGFDRSRWGVRKPEFVSRHSISFAPKRTRPPNGWSCSFCDCPQVLLSALPPTARKGGV